MTPWRAQRLSKLPPYLFVEITRRKQAALAAGHDVIDFGVGDPDRPTPGFIIEAMIRGLHDPANHRYPAGTGTAAFRQAVADFFRARFRVNLDPGREVLALIGSKEGLGHLPTAVINPGDVALIPEPGYPVYVSGTIFAGGTCHTMALTEDRGWLPDLSAIPPEVCARARLMFLNYPNNPTAACAPRSFFEEAVAFARRHDLLIAQDAAYSEMYFDQPPPSILQVDGARDVAIEFHSLSKTFNMTGWRIGFAVGQPDALAALAAVKSNVDSGVFQPVQEAGIAALRGYQLPEVVEQLDIYRRRRDLLINGLREAGWSVCPPPATFYVWARVPGGGDSMSAATRLLEEAHVVAIPGVGFGAAGEGYLRFALTVDEARTRDAVSRIGRLAW